MKNGRTGFVRSTGDYSRDRHIEFQRNSIYFEFLQMEEELFGGDKTERKALQKLGLDSFLQAKRIQTPEQYTQNVLSKRTDAAQVRFDMIQPALSDERCITDPSYRSTVFKQIAEENRTTTKRIQKLFCTYLATGIHVSV